MCVVRKSESEKESVRSRVRVFVCSEERERERLCVKRERDRECVYKCVEGREWRVCVCCLVFAGKAMSVP